VTFLETLFLASNKISKIEGLEKLPELRVLELGANEIPVLHEKCLNLRKSVVWNKTIE
jgi:Leucine-rich repeat (LRR) protein